MLHTIIFIQYIIIMYIFIIIIVKKGTVGKLKTYSAHIDWFA